MDPHAAGQRRRYQRVELDAPIRVSTIDPELDPYTGRSFFRSFEDRCVNLSRGGLLLRSHETLAPGRRILLEVELPGGPRFEAVARIAWTSPAGEELDHGIEFLGGIPDHLTRLERFLGRALHSAA
ncbi:MAG: PilZ domain-containing protein [Deltaproteobacteria bacterium]|nr:PilZ domain-containing protein [Deltaproteobacteria bacterium]